MSLDIMDSFVKTAQKIAEKRVDEKYPNLPAMERVLRVEAELELIFTAMMQDAITKLDIRS